MGMIKEFKEFALKGNMIDMAVGIVIGGAFGTVIKSIVADIVTPPLGLLTEKVDFANMGYVLREKAEGVSEIKIGFGAFLNNLIAFLIVAAAIFVVIKIMNRVREQFEAEEPEADPTTKPCGECKMEIPIKATRCGHCTSQVAA